MFSQVDGAPCADMGLAVPAVACLTPACCVTMNISLAFALQACQRLVRVFNLSPAQYQVGRTKIFFRCAACACLAVAVPCAQPFL